MYFFWKSFQRGLFATLFVTLSLIPSAISQNTGQYPLCPRTGLLPQLNTQPFTRCLRANGHTCCSNCFDLQLGLEEVSVNFTSFTQALSPNISAGYAFSSVHLCALFVGHHDCQFALEQFACAMNCDPDGGSYIFGSAFQVCNSTAASVYQACSGLTVPGLQVSNLATLFSSPNEYLAKLFLGFSSSMGGTPYNFTVVSDDASCYKLPPVLPRQPVCCDPLPVSASCAPYVNLDATYPSLLPFVNRQVDPQDCVLKALAPSPIESPSQSPSLPPPVVQLTAPTPPPFEIVSGGLGNSSLPPSPIPTSKPSSGHAARPGLLFLTIATFCFALL